jgi:putative DNA primase/helicase
VSTDPLLRHEGSAAFTQVVRGGLMLGHDPDDPDAEDGNQRVLAVSSSNLAAPAPSIVYRIDTAHVQGDTGEEITTARVVPIGESGANAHDLLKGRDGEERTGTDEAVEFLEEVLSGGPRQADEIIIQARRLGISEKMLRAARGRLGIKPTKTGFRAGWEWALPEGSLPSEDRGHLRESGDRGRLREIPLVERDCGPSPDVDSPEGALINGDGALGAFQGCAVHKAPVSGCRCCGGGS